MTNLGPAGGQHIAKEYSFVGKKKHNNMTIQNFSVIWRNIFFGKKNIWMLDCWTVFKKIA